MNSRRLLSTRRHFLQTALVTAGAVSARAETKAPASETLAASLFGTLSAEQKAALCFPFAHPLRWAVDNNWHITKQAIGSFLNVDQQQLVKEIFLHLHSAAYRDQVLKEVEHDNVKSGGFGASSIAFYFRGKPHVHTWVHIADPAVPQERTA